jgi:hypothetical protein
MITTHIDLQHQIFTSNYSTLLYKLQSQADIFKTTFSDSNSVIMTETDLASSLIYIVNMLTNADRIVRDVLSNNNNNNSNNHTNNNNSNTSNNNTNNTNSNTNNNTNNNNNSNNTNNNTNNNTTNNNNSIPSEYIPIPFHPIAKKSPFFRKISLFLSFHRLHDAGK